MGTYVYCGSALGPGGVRARVRRHVDGAQTLHWHIDHLLRRAQVQEVWARVEPRRIECEWASALGNAGRFTCPAAGFGSSDCRCRAHLWRAEMSPASLGAALRRLPSPPQLLWRLNPPADML